MEKRKLRERKNIIELQSKVIIYCLTPGIKINHFKYEQTKMAYEGKHLTSNIAKHF